MTVSYTHLDVYKRQEYLSAYDKNDYNLDSSIALQKPFSEPVEKETVYSVTANEGTEDNTYPVSYTHLVKDGEDVSQTAGELEKKGLIKNIYAFLFQSRFYDYDKIYPGTYTLNTSMTSKEILQKLSEKPEDAEDDKSADKPESAKAAQKTADQNTGGSENAKQKRQKDLQEEEANAADPARSTLSSEEAQADEHSYSCLLYTSRCV